MTLEPKNWQVRIQRPAFGMQLEFYIYRYSRPGTEFLESDGHVRHVDESAIADGVIKPTFIMSGFEGKEMMISLAEALQEEGVKTSEAARIQGLLDATKYHLEDMRKLALK